MGLFYEFSYLVINYLKSKITTRNRLQYCGGERPQCLPIGMYLTSGAIKKICCVRVRSVEIKKESAVSEVID